MVWIEFYPIILLFHEILQILNRFVVLSESKEIFAQFAQKQSDLEVFDRNKGCLKIPFYIRKWLKIFKIDQILSTISRYPLTLQILLL